jgi:hypothetical protein
MKAGDIGLSLFIILIFILLYLLNILAIGIKNVKDDWPKYRCNPIVMPFAGILAPNGTGATENFTYCIQNMQSNYMQHLLQPVNYNLGVLGDTTSSISNSVNAARAFFDKLRNMIKDTVVGIFSVFLNLIIEFQRTIINIKDLFAKLVGILASLLFILDGSMKTMESTWNGPPGQLVRKIGKMKICFRPDTLLRLENGSNVMIKDIKLGDKLKNGSEVVGTMMLNNLNNNGERIENLYKISGGENEQDIYVTGEHLIYNDESSEFIHVMNHIDAIETDESSDHFCCLITTNHLITIGDRLFHDWEDNNGSSSKDV